MAFIQQKKLTPNSTIGILGGGQLGRMSCFAAHKMGFKTVIFSNEENAPAEFVTNKTIIADFKDEKALHQFADLVDVISFEFENIPVESVEFLEKIKPVFPSSKVLKVTQNRILEKSFVNKIGIKTADFVEVKSLEDLKNGLTKFGKAILKTATLGYDGKGQFILNEGEELEKIWVQVASKELILEKFCPFEKEISVIVAKGLNEEIACFEPLENIHKNGILDKSIYPANIAEDLKIKAQNAAKKIAEEIGLVGVLAIEFFVLAEGVLLVNEMAPRPHNSGHFSMDSAITCQFEQFIRAISGLNLGNPQFHSQGYMQNLIGFDVEKIDEFLQNKNAKIHLYGKEKIVAGRKMGHVNVLDI